MKAKINSKWVVGGIFLLPFIFYILLTIGKHNFTRLPYYTSGQKIVEDTDAPTIQPSIFFQENGEKFLIETPKIRLWHLVHTKDYLLTPAILANLQFLQDQFSDRNDIEFISIVCNQTDGADVADFIQTLHIQTDNWKVLYALDSVQTADFVTNKLFMPYRVLPDSLSQVVPNQHVALTDQDGHLRGYFDGATHKEVKGELLDAMDMLIREKYIVFKKK